MSYHNDTNNQGESFDLNRIFIGRQQQLDLFDVYLGRWQQLMLNLDPDKTTALTDAPSPNNKLPGLVVLLHGRGGFGKSTLLKHYYAIARQAKQHLTISKIIDWEFAIEGKRSLLNPPPGQEIEATEYFKLLHGELARALDKRGDDFKHYQKALKAIDEAKKEASKVLDSVPPSSKDDRYSTLRWLSSEGTGQLLRLVAAHTGPLGLLLNNDQLSTKVKELAGKEAAIGADQLLHLYTNLKNRLGPRLDDYINPALRLGLALGTDLAECARNFPLLIFCDTYEEIDEGDRLLRMVMGAAGARVGWVLAGRDNLWAGLEQRERSTDIEYGYKEIVPSDWGLSINFNAGDVGAFTLSDIIAYFDQLCQMVKHCPLPAVLEVGAKRILEITQGVPLAVKIAAGLYVDTADLNMITEEVGGKREIVDQMVRRYLLHARDQQSERATLYALALLRRADHPPTVAVALGLTPVSAKTSYASTLSRLQRRYSFIFTEKDKPSLHQEVRHFLRLWLLEHHDQPEIVAINERLKDAHDTVLKKLEEQRKYSRLEERLKDDQWVEAYLDLAEQHYWLAPVEGLLYLLPFIIAAAIYRRNANNKGAVAVGSFFEKSLQAPYCDWWRWVAQTLRHVANTTASDKEQLMLESLEQLVTGPRCPVFRPPLPEFRPELEAALCWRLGEAYLYQDGNKALAWYEKCINRLGDNVSLKKNVAAALVKVAGDLEKEKKHAERIPLLSRAIELMPDFSLAYVERGCAYDDLQAYQQAMADFDRAIELKPDYSWAYNNRGVVYSRQRKFQQALTNYNHAIELDANYAQPYANRGVVHAILQESQQALTDCNRAIELEPDDATFHQDRGDAHLFLGDRVQALADFNHAYSLDRTYISPLWMIEWANMGKKRAELEVAERLEKIAMINPKDQTAYICQGVAAGLRGQLKAGLAALEQAISIVPGDFGANFWKGMLSAYYYQGRYQIAIEAFEKSIANSLPPILRTPLYWLEDDRPDFFEQYARPLLEKYGI